MSTRRATLTAAAMGGIAVLLDALTPHVRMMTAALVSAQRTADLLGPDAVVVSAAGLLAWGVWAWGVLGLALAAVSSLPGLAGATASVVLQGVVPSGARRCAAAALGIGLGVAGPLLATASAVLSAPAAAGAPADPVPDWPVTAPPGTGGTPVPDWPGSSGDHVVVRGDCLWDVAAGRLADQQHRNPTNRETAAGVHAWWAVNADVIGPDPDLLLPGQVLHPPDPAPHAVPSHSVTGHSEPSHPTPGSHR